MKKMLAGLAAITMLMGVAYADSRFVSEMVVSSIFYSSEELTFENGLKYVVNTDGTGITITGCDTSVTEIQIPAEIDGLPVTNIGGEAFYNCTSLTEITIPDSVTNIEFSAFVDCTSLNSVTIPDSVISISYHAFFNTAILNNQSTDLKYVDNWLVNCDNKEIEKAEIKEGTKGIAYSAFEDCTSLISVTIPDSVTSIDECAFKSCELLNSVIIPDSVTNIGIAAFSWCISLTSITIPDSVTRIGDWAFGSCTSLTEVIIHNSVTSIDKGAFVNCTSLTSVTIPDSVTSIGDWAFGYYFDDENLIVKIEDFIIYGVKGSAAETYAIENEFKFVEIENPSTEKTGDIDSDSKTTSSDAPNVLLAFIELITGLQKFADLDGDGEITSSDALYVLQMIVGLK